MCILHKKPQKVNREIKKKGSVLLNDLDLKKIKIDLLDKGILTEARFGMAFQFLDIIVKPYGLSQIKLHADAFQGGKYFVGSCVGRIIAYHGIGEHPVVLKDFGP